MLTCLEPFCYNFLFALTEFRRLTTLRLYATLGLEILYDLKHESKIQTTRLEADIMTVQHLARYLVTKKVGCAFRKIEWCSADFPKLVIFSAITSGIIFCSHVM